MCSYMWVCVGMCMYIVSICSISTMLCPARLRRIGSPGLGLSIVPFHVLVIGHRPILISTDLSSRYLRITPRQQRTLVIQMRIDCSSGQPIPISRPKGSAM